MTAAGLIRSLVKEIVLVPHDSEIQIDVRCDLACIPGISLRNKICGRKRAARLGRLVWAILRGDLDWLREHAAYETDIR